MRIGTLELPDRPVLLAPMAGVTDAAFRLICRELGADLTCTEMVSAKALFFRNKNTAALLHTEAGERPAAVQLFGTEPDLMAQEAEKLADRFDLIDLNMGCPVAKIVNNGEGSALMKDPARAADIVRTVAARAGRPVSVKIRAGYDAAHRNAAEFAAALEEAGAAMITVHGRTREQFYSGRADRGIIRAVKEAVRIPVIGNGDIFCAQDALDLLEETGCDGVMVARGARGNPWIFREIRALLRGGPLPEPPGPEEKRAVVLRHARGLAAERGEAVAAREMRKHLAWYTTGLHGASRLRAEANTVSTLEELEKLTDRFFAGEEGR